MNRSSPGKEILPARFFTDIKFNELLQSTDLTLIFNQHGDSEDAERSTDYIPPQSTVFVEGLTLAEASTASGVLNDLNLIRLYYGLESQEYNFEKQLVLEAFTNLAYLPAEKGSDFHVHSAREIGLLIEKDCYVAYADYNVGMLRQTTKGNPLVETIHQNFQKDYQDASFTPFIDNGLKYANNYAKAIRGIERAEHAENAKHHTRELAAFTSYFSNIYDISRAPYGHELTHQNDGRLKTFMIYGTAHKDSLAQQFINWGMEPSVQVLSSIHDSECIPPNTPDYHQEIKRKIAINSFKSLACYMGADYNTAQQLSQNLLKPFEQLNQSTEDYRRILCELLDILNKDREDPNVAGKRLNDTYVRIIDGNV